MDFGPRELTSTSRPTQFPELNELLAEFVRRVRSIFGDDFVGAYLTGSFALGGGDAASDCDFIVVTTDQLTVEHERALRALHDEIPKWPGYWAYNLEGSYAPKADLRTLAALGRQWLYVNRGAREMDWSTHCNAEDVRWVLRERAPTLAGSAAREFACEVPGDLLRSKTRPHVENFLEDLLTWATFDVSWTQRYAVEALSRMLSTLEQGEVISKRRALEWAKDVMPDEWQGLIRQVCEDRFVTWNAPPRPGSVQKTGAFVEYARQRARAPINA
jgi:predicted nucleotidyltransferase